jgi:hypothetical protein
MDMFQYLAGTQVPTPFWIHSPNILAAKSTKYQSKNTWNIVHLTKVFHWTSVLDTTWSVNFFGEKSTKGDSFLKREYSVAKSLFLWKKLSNCGREPVFWEGCFHIHVYWLQIYELSGKESRQLSRNLPRDAYHYGSIRELKRKHCNSLFNSLMLLFRMTVKKHKVDM